MSKGVYQPFEISSIKTSIKRPKKAMHQEKYPQIRCKVDTSITIQVNLAQPWKTVPLLTRCLLLNPPHTLLKTRPYARRRPIPTLHGLLKRRHITLTPRMYPTPTTHRIRSQPQTTPLHNLIFFYSSRCPIELILSSILICSVQTWHALSSTWFPSM